MDAVCLLDDFDVFINLPDWIMTSLFLTPMSQSTLSFLPSISLERILSLAASASFRSLKAMKANPLF